EATPAGRVPAPMGVAGEDEVGAAGAAGRLDAAGILVGREAADLELAAGHARAPVGFDLVTDVGVRLARHVVAADGDDRQLGAVAAEQLPHAAAGGLADEIPERAVHAGDRFEQRLAVALRVAEVEHVCPDALALEDALAADARSELVVDDPDDLAPVAAVVAVVDLAHEPIARAQPRDHRAAFEHVVRAAAEVLRQRDVERDRLDAADAVIHRLASPSAAARTTAPTMSSRNRAEEPCGTRRAAPCG